VWRVPRPAPSLLARHWPDREVQRGRRVPVSPLAAIALLTEPRLQGAVLLRTAELRMDYGLAARANGGVSAVN
jgi:hypothetical protein